MNTAAHSSSSAKTSAKASPKTSSANLEGPLDWRHLVHWLHVDGVISEQEAARTVARCSQAESAQHPLLRLASVSMKRAANKFCADYDRG